MDERSEIAWLYRRVGFGLAPGQLEELTARGTAAALDALVDPSGAGVAPAPDPWAGTDPTDLPAGQAKTSAFTALIGDWLAAMVTTPRPLEEWMRWFWHGHFVITARVVPFPALVLDHLRMLGSYGLGDFRSLLHEVTVDPAMLIYLDGDSNAIGAVNENYGREVLELFSLGIGNYTEDDVRSAAVALTGYRVVDRTSRPRRVFASTMHDDSAQRFLGRDGVHDVDTVVDAIVAHPACPVFVTRKLAKAILGPAVEDGVIERLAGDFAASGLEIRPLVRAILEAGLDGAGGELVRAPVPWMIGSMKATGAPVAPTLKAVAKGGLSSAGQMPLDAPNVGGWPGGRAWQSASAVVARCNMAAGIAANTPSDAALRRAATARDVDALAAGLGYPEGYGQASAAAIAELDDPRRSKGADAATAALAVAMAAPETALA